MNSISHTGSFEQQVQEVAAFWGRPEAVEATIINLAQGHLKAYERKMMEEPEQRYASFGVFPKEISIPCAIVFRVVQEFGLECDCHPTIDSQNQPYHIHLIKKKI